MAGPSTTICVSRTGLLYDGPSNQMLQPDCFATTPMVVRSLDVLLELVALRKRRKSYAPIGCEVGAVLLVLVVRK